jgi:uncharacterized protein (TIGR03435 family)
MKRLIVSVFAIVSVAAGSQTTTRGPEAFEAASVKPSQPGETSVRMMALPGGRLSVSNTPLRLLIRNAYNVLDLQIVNGPDWLNTERFDIDATSTGNPTQPQIQAMFRRLLSDRFKLTVHTETRELPIYVLVMARSDRRPGPRLRPAEPCARTPADGPPQQPPPPGSVPCGFTVGAGRGAARGVTMSAFASSLSSQVGRVVQDRTGLAGNFDLEFEYTPVSTSTTAADGASIFTALSEQLGLKLEPQRGPVEVLVIDRVERPGPE